MARPKKNTDKKLRYHVIFRLSAVEYDRLCRKAEKAGLPPNELARRLTRKGERRLIVQTSFRHDPAFLKRIDRIGHNLNQLVKNAHIFGRISPRVAFICEEINGVLAQALAEMEAAQRQQQKEEPNDTQNC